ncbi:DUF692 domain-containing protein [Pseudofrankia asymbiotica]|uniref:SCO6045-like C-terminal domain-containing protein n=1 Tax=Pseudofrankia asymbiotica TaxID=1834516 RepID=A0A1V2I7H5_9ACTN|nr:DUF692 domain-containing protein [Pseudofrankia asymbiotica]ONH27547.1 hypothetical protein BL253_21915 [Pseudofrankia asymbiotica]
MVRHARTHARPSGSGIRLRLLAELTARCDPPGVLLERDRDYPPAGEIAAELALIRNTVEEARASRSATGPRAPRVRSRGGHRLGPRQAVTRRLPGEVRDRLGKAQHDLLTALVGNGPVPAGFDAPRLGVQARALVERRERMVSPLLPGLVWDLGARFGTLFRAYAAEHPPPVEGPRYDADTFARYLASRTRSARSSSSPPTPPAC